MQRYSRRELAKSFAAAAACAALAPVREGIGSGKSPSIDAMSLVNPDFRADLIKLLPEMEKESYTTATLQHMRKLADNWGEPPDPVPSVTLQTIPGAADQPNVRIYIIGHDPARTRPAILHIHGGGYVVGRAIDAVKHLQELALRHDCLIVTVDYRLAPETRFPGSLEDNYAALKWLYNHAGELGVDRRRIAVMGGSAGGGHAAALAIAARGRGEIPICLQILIYPMLDDRTGSTRQPAPWIGTYVWKRASNRFGWSSLLGVSAGSAVVPKGAVPARIEDLSGLPPAFIGVGSIDLFVDEDVEYARRLIDAGVSTELYVVSGGYHAFDAIAPSAPATLLFGKVVDGAIDRAFKSG